MLHKLGAQTIDGATYGVDAVGNRTSKLNHINSVTESYSYDAIYQLTQVVQGGTTTTEAYSYDKVGNRLSSLGTTSYSYNNSNQLTSTSNATYTYDNNGNTLTKTDASGTTTYAWDFENRLSSVTLPNQSVVTFKYDPLGRRVQKASASGTINYLYEAADIAEEVDATGVVLARYAMGPGIDQPLSMLRGGASSYYEADGLGSITSLTDGAGSAAASYVFDSFGKQTSPEGGVTNAFRYTAREADAETGLYFYRARFYDSAVARFRSEDPIGFLGGENFYRYVRNAPIGHSDPSGLADPATVAVTGWTLAEVGTGTAAVGTAGAGAAVVGAGVIGWYTGRAIGGISIGNGRTVDDAVTSAFTRVLIVEACRSKVKYCTDRYEREVRWCQANLWGTEYYGACKERAQWRWNACLRGMPDPGPLDPRTW